MTEDAHLRCNRVPTPEYLKAWPDVTNRCPPTKRESPSAACVSEKHTQSQRTSFNSAFIPLSRAGIWTLAFLHRNQKGVGLVWHAVLDRCCPYEEVGCFPFFPLPLLEFCNETSAFCFNSPISGLSTSSCHVAHSPSHSTTNEDSTTLAFTTISHPIDKDKASVSTRTSAFESPHSGRVSVRLNPNKHVSGTLFSIGKWVF